MTTSLISSQLRVIRDAAYLLRPRSRLDFYRSVYNRLAGPRKPDDHEVAAAINLVLSGHGIATGSEVFRCFTKEKQHATDHRR